MIYLSFMLDTMSLSGANTMDLGDNVLSDGADDPATVGTGS